MAKKSAVSAAVGYKYGRLVEQSGGMVDSVVHPALLKDNEARLLKNVSISEKGTVKTTIGRQSRFPAPFDAANPCNGIAAFYPNTTTSRLVMGAGTKLYKDTPHLITQWKDQANFEEAGSVRTPSCDTTTTAGDIKIKTTVPILTHSGTPRYLAGKYAQSLILEEMTTNMLTANQSSIETDTTGFTPESGVTITRVAGGVFGSYQLRVVTPAGTVGTWVEVGAITGAIGDKFTFSYYANSYQTRAYVYQNGSLLLSSSTFPTTAGYQRREFTFTLTAANPTIRLNIANASGAPQTFHIDGLQLQKGKYATTWMLGGTTRNAESLAIPTAGALSPVEGTVNVWVNVNDLSKRYLSDNIAPTLLMIPRSGVSDFGIWLAHLHNSANWGLYIKNSASNSNQVTVADSYTPNGLHMFTVAWDTTSAILYIDGVPRGAIDSPPLPSFFGTNAYLGAWMGSSDFANTDYDDLSIDYVKRTPEEIATWYASGIPQVADEFTTALFHFDGNLTASPIAGAVWASATKDISAAVDTASGKVAYTATVPGASSVTFETRTSEDGTTWDPWTVILQDGTIQSTYRKYIQTRARLRLSGTDIPSVQDITMSFDGTPTAAELGTGFTAGSQFFFATLLNTLIATNMLDAPKKWDGTSAMADLGGTPPHAQYVATHRNYVFMARTVANPNRLYFSEVLNFDSWPVLNFIDVSPNDGDWITGLMPYDDYLIIAKNRSIWLLMGTGPSDFEVRRIHDGVGCVAPRSLTKMGQSFVFASTEGYYMSDLSQEVLLSERLKDTWRGLNQRRLNQIAAVYYDHKLRIDVPNGSSTINNMRIIYDTIQKALSLEEFTDHASCYAKFTEAGHEILLYGHSNEGQVSRADYGTTDGGQPIPMTWGTKYFNFGSSAIEKKLRYLYLVVIPAGSETTLNIYLVVNGVRESTPLTAVVPGDTNGVARTIKLDPRRIGVRKVKSIGYDVIQSSSNGGIKIHELLQEYMTRKIKET